MELTMNTVVKKKLNLLTHLARVDGKFHKSEREIINVIASEAGLDVDDIDAGALSNESFELGNEKDKSDIIYLALKLVQADGIVAEEELKFCREIALKLKYKPALIDHYVHRELPEPALFEEQIRNWKI